VHAYEGAFPRSFECGSRSTKAAWQRRFRVDGEAQQVAGRYGACRPRDLARGRASRAVRVATSKFGTQGLNSHHDDLTLRREDRFDIAQNPSDDASGRGDYRHRSEGARRHATGNAVARHFACAATTVLNSGAGFGESGRGWLLHEAIENDGGSDGNQDGRTTREDERAHTVLSVSHRYSAYLPAAHAESLKALVSMSMKVPPSAPTRA
jgi:hypothetical protein